jgi:hypothetical protein
MSNSEPFSALARGQFILLPISSRVTDSRKVSRIAVAMEVCSTVVPSRDANSHDGIVVK